MAIVSGGHKEWMVKARVYGLQLSQSRKSTLISRACSGEQKLIASTTASAGEQVNKQEATFVKESEYFLRLRHFRRKTPSLSIPALGALTLTSLQTVSDQRTDDWPRGSAIVMTPNDRAGGLCALRIGITPSCNVDPARFACSRNHAWNIKTSQSE